MAAEVVANYVDSSDEELNDELFEMIDLSEYESLSLQIAENIKKLAVYSYDQRIIHALGMIRDMELGIQNLRKLCLDFIDEVKPRTSVLTAELLIFLSGDSDVPAGLNTMLESYSGDVPSNARNIIEVCNDLTKKAIMIGTELTPDSQTKFSKFLEIVSSVSLMIGYVTGDTKPSVNLSDIRKQMDEIYGKFQDDPFTKTASIEQLSEKIKEDMRQIEVRFRRIKRSATTMKPLSPRRSENNLRKARSYHAGLLEIDKELDKISGYWLC